MRDALAEGFSRPVVVAELPAEGLVMALRATEAERQALARRFDLLSLPAFEGEMRVRSNFAGEIELRGRFVATVEQTCVVTLEAFSSQLKENFHLRLARSAAEEEEEEQSWTAGQEVPPEPIEGETIDLGELLAQQLGLAIDPYPRRPGASLDPKLLQEEAGAGRASPFAGLASLKNKHSD
jgi:uncharacterized metal-binding protein YceD (DUF177 family)